ncbi:MAG: pseudouridine synthase [Anaerolineales bacterium]
MSARKASIVVRFNKPYGVLSAFRPPSDYQGQTLKDYIEIDKDVHAVGRLDKDSEGLLLLSNDAWLIQRLLEPRFEHPRTYWVQVEQRITDHAVDALRQGVTLKGYTTRPAEVRRLDPPPDIPPRDPPIRYRKTVPTDWIELTLREGKNRQVRKMTAHVGHPTLRLIRVAIGPITLAGLALGEWAHLNEDEQHALRKSISMSKPG